MAKQFSAQIVTRWARTRVFDYLADFRNLVEWHPAVHECELESSEPRIRNARYRAKASIAGRRIPARIVTRELERPTLILAVAENAGARTEDRFDLESAGEGLTALTYRSQMELKLPLRVIGPLMVPGLTQTWTDSVKQLEQVLQAERVTSAADART